MSDEKEKAVKILDVLKDILNDNDVTLPCNPDYDLEAAIVDIFETAGDSKDTITNEIIKEIKKQLADRNIKLFDENSNAFSELVKKVVDIVIQ